MRRRLDKILAGIGGHDLECAECRDLGAGIRRSVEIRDPASKRFDDVSVHRAALEALQQRRLAGEALHLDRPFHGLASAVHGNAVAGAGHGHHALVNVRSQTAVEPDFLVTKMAALRQRGEIKEAQVDRLFDLVRVRAGQEHHRDMSMAYLHVPNRVRVRRPVAERLDQQR